MSNPLIITSTDSILDTLDFKPFRSTVERRVVPFLPDGGEPQTMEIHTSWGTQLAVDKGDILVSEIDTPNDFWAVDPLIFEESYIISRPGYCVKKAITLLVPLTDITNDPDRDVTVVSLEGPQTVRAGDFFLARGVQGEIWPIPKNTAEAVMAPAKEGGKLLLDNQKSGGTPFSSQRLVITSTDPIISKLSFKPYYTKVERRVVPFLPAPDAPQNMVVNTPGGEMLVARKGDFLVSEIDAPHAFWPVDPAMFQQIYFINRPGYCVKKAPTLLVPLTDITDDPDREVIIDTLREKQIVRAGDFFLARGSKGEIWPIPKETVNAAMAPAEDGDNLQPNNKKSDHTPTG